MNYTITKEQKDGVVNAIASSEMKANIAFQLVQLLNTLPPAETPKEPKK